MYARSTTPLSTLTALRAAIGTLLQYAAAAQDGETPFETSPRFLRSLLVVVVPLRRLVVVLHRWLVTVLHGWLTILGCAVLGCAVLRLVVLSAAVWKSGISMCLISYTIIDALAGTASKGGLIVCEWSEARDVL